MGYGDKVIGNILGGQRVFGSLPTLKPLKPLKSIKPLKDLKSKNRDDDGRIVSNKDYGQHILIQDSTGVRWSTKNIAPIGCRTLFDGNSIHGKDTKPDIIIDYEL